MNFRGGCCTFGTFVQRPLHQDRGFELFQQHRCGQAGGLAAGVTGTSYRVRARGQELTLQKRAKGEARGYRYVRKGPGSVRRKDAAETDGGGMRAERRPTQAGTGRRGQGCCCC